MKLPALISSSSTCKMRMRSAAQARTQLKARAPDVCHPRDISAMSVVLVVSLLYKASIR